jgi:uncharacterized protein (TIGR01777 family)
VRVAVTGATGVIGRRAIAALVERADQVVALTRDTERGRDVLGPRVELHAWSDPKHAPAPTAALERADAVLHLLGEPIAQRWSGDAKREIRDSRVLSTRSLVAAISALPEDRRPRALVSQSATGYYGPRGDEPVPESSPAGDDFLAKVTIEWEREAGQAVSAGVRVATTRTGVVLSPTGGALAKMLPPFKLGVGGPVAGGKQYVPWIHLDDVVGAMLRCLDDDAASGPLNLTAPNPATNGELSKTLGRVLRRPAILPVPGLALRAMYGEMATIVLTGQRAVPVRLRELGYEFRHPQLEDALRDVLSGS